MSTFRPTGSRLSPANPVPCRSNFRLRGYHTNRGNVLNKSTLSINRLTYSRLDRVLPGPYDTSSTSTQWDRKQTAQEKKQTNSRNHLRIFYELYRTGRAFARSSPYLVKQKWHSSDVSPYRLNFPIANCHNQLHREGEVRNPDVNKAKLGLVLLSICLNVVPQHSIQTIVFSFRAYDAMLARPDLALLCELGQTTRP